HQFRGQDSSDPRPFATRAAQDFGCGLQRPLSGSSSIPTSSTESRQDPFLNLSDLNHVFGDICYIQSCNRSGNIKGGSRALRRFSVRICPIFGMSPADKMIGQIESRG
ncbi:MAG TPA: hypothetical protein VMD92_01540, partial [Acidobacteriaceae bacterium]|nr:hypothetical protein [Acidobacteriaceae bacterium]